MYFFELIEEERRAAHEAQHAEYMLASFLKKAEEGKSPEDFVCLVGGIGNYQQAVEAVERAGQRIERVHEDIARLLRSIT